MAVFLLANPDCVLIHIPKTGGTSIRRGHFADAYEGPVQGAVPEAWMPLFKFAFVRNPYDRVISAWKMFSSGMEQAEWQLPPDGKPGIGLRAFLDVVTDESIPFDVRDTYEQKIRHHTIPQTHPYNCLDAADFVGRFEALGRDWRRICEHLGVAACELPHWNRTRRRDHRSYFDAECRGIVARYYREDLRTQGYGFEPAPVGGPA